MAAPIEVAIPFGVAADGSIAIEKIPDRQIHQHVRSLVATNLTERVMMSTYGCGLIGMLFEPDDDLVETNIARQVSDALLRWEPSLVGVSVKPIKNVSGDGIASVEVLYSRSQGAPVPIAGPSLINTATIRVGGQVLESVHG